MFKASQIRWLVTALVATAAALVVVAPASAWEDVQRMNGVGQGSMPPAAVQERASIHSNLTHEGRLADQRLGTAVATHTGLGAQGLPVYKHYVDNGYIPGVTDSSIGVAEQVRQIARDNVVTDKAAPETPPIPYLSHGEGVDSSFGETYIPGVTDSGTGVLRDLGVDVPPVAATTREVSDDGFNWSSDTVIGISAALLTALLMALGTFALVSQRRRRMAL